MTSLHVLMLLLLFESEVYSRKLQGLLIWPDGGGWGYLSVVHQLCGGVRMNASPLAYNKNHIIMRGLSILHGWLWKRVVFVLLELDNGIGESVLALYEFNVVEGESDGG